MRINPNRVTGQLVVELAPDAAEQPQLLGPVSVGEAGGGGFRLVEAVDAPFQPMFRVAGSVRQFLSPQEISLSDRSAGEVQAAAPLNRILFAPTDPNIKPETALGQLKDLRQVSRAYWAPPAMPAGSFSYGAKTADYTSFQGYHWPAPAGIDTGFAWTLGASGQGVTVLDVEGGWTLNHQDLYVSAARVVHGRLSDDPLWIDHGTAVLGQMVSTPTGSGCIGICFNSNVAVSSVFQADGSYNPAAAIQAAADSLNPGDVLVIELHRPGPRYPGDGSQFGYLPVEFWHAEFLAIQYAIQIKGLIVVEAAGNGGQDLDDPLYDPADGVEPQMRDSGAILVGAGAPPSGLYGPDRSRMDFSNYGARVDCQGWGAGVVTLGYGDLLDGSPQQQYTATFSGTSSATPIVAGACACLQSCARARGGGLDCATVRSFLRTTGSVQTDGFYGTVAQRIGTRPDLRQLLPLVT